MRYSGFQVIKQALSGHKAWIGGGNVGRNTTIIRSNLVLSRLCSYPLTHLCGLSLKCQGAFAT